MCVLHKFIHVGPDYQSKTIEALFVSKCWPVVTGHVMWPVRVRDTMQPPVRLLWAGLKARATNSCVRGLPTCWVPPCCLRDMCQLQASPLALSELHRSCLCSWTLLIPTLVWLPAQTLDPLSSCTSPRLLVDPRGHHQPAVLTSFMCCGQGPHSLAFIPLPSSSTLRPCCSHAPASAPCGAGGKTYLWLLGKTDHHKKKVRSCIWNSLV